MYRPLIVLSNLILHNWKRDDGDGLNNLDLAMRGKKFAMRSVIMENIRLSHSAYINYVTKANTTNFRTLLFTKKGI